MITIIDYDMGNLKSVAKAFEKVGAEVRVTRDPKVIRNAKKIVLPGVGAFTECMANLEKYELVDVIKDQIQTGKPFLGICLGLQLLFEQSEEFGPTPGLGIIQGKVKKFAFDSGLRAEDSGLKVSQMGWNQIRFQTPSPLYKDIPDNSDFYFVHSYYVDPTDKSIIATTTDYGINYCSSIQKDNIFACQFHPEKSQKRGLQLIQNFVELSTLGESF